MVDTINPNTSQPDSWGDAKAPATTPENRFFGGFDQPEDVKINLAGSQAQEAEQPVAPSPQPVIPDPQPQQVAQQPLHDVAAPIKPAEVKHTTYTNTSDMINWRGVLVIVAIGLLATLVIGVGLFFGLGAMNSSKLKSQEKELTNINTELAALQETPNPLGVPVAETPTTEAPATETPVVVPVTTPTEEPVTAPTTTVSPTQEDGRLGTG